MFDAGFLEVLVIGVIALLVVGPERLPGVASKIGSLIGKARRFVDTTKADIEREINASEMRELLQSQKKEIDELRSFMDDTKHDIHTQASEVQNDIKAGLENVTNTHSSQSASPKHND